MPNTVATNFAIVKVTRFEVVTFVREYLCRKDVMLVEGRLRRDHGTHKTTGLVLPRLRLLAFLALALAISEPSRAAGWLS